MYIVYEWFVAFTSNQKRMCVFCAWRISDLSFSCAFYLSVCFVYYGWIEFCIRFQCSDLQQQQKKKIENKNKKKEYRWNIFDWTISFLFICVRIKKMYRMWKKEMKNLLDFSNQIGDFLHKRFLIKCFHFDSLIFFFLFDFYWMAHNNATMKTNINDTKFYFLNDSGGDYLWW